MARIRVTKLRKKEDQSRIDMWLKNRIDYATGVLERVEGDVKLHASIHFGKSFGPSTPALGKISHSSIRMTESDMTVSVTGLMRRTLIYKMFMAAIEELGWYIVEVR